ncbi:MAG TPA: TetR/AcrR family transcriptional regulator [Bacteroidia bacterium]|nr:TetR/AcrR family transcriptional regulator [Bacteroidia bacterium]
MAKRSSHTTQVPPLSSEEKIKEAARKVFTQKGFAATRTRDIAKEAGINLALLNYYFRSKEKLFELVMFESASQFFASISAELHNPKTSLEQKLTVLVNHYIDLLMNEPDFPVFILHEIQSNPSRLINRMQAIELLPQSVFFKQLAAQLKKCGNTLPPVHFLINTMALLVFPFVARPMIAGMFRSSEAQFRELMNQRRELVPRWVMQMLKEKNTNKKHKS